MYIIDQNKCNNCGECYQVCMNGAIIQNEEFFFIDPGWCTLCGSCQAICNESAIAFDFEEEIIHDGYIEFFEYEEVLEYADIDWNAW